MDNDITSLVVQFIDPLLGNKYVNIATAVVALFSAIAATTKTPASNSTWAKAYKIIDFLAINIGKAKDKSK